ncbi:MAG: glycoside hydrolase family 3 C-terminal domain-containing protein [Bacteroidales bacterium]|nr:glycoside hydrolase family 3 C-terminal domain-containing protein [Bacteroidales bacterium]
MNKTLSLIMATVLCAAPVFAKINPSHVKRAEDLVKQMTLEEKVSLISGSVDGFHTAAIERLGIPSIRMADGPQGVRNNTHSTYYPCGISLAASWNRSVAGGVGKGIGLDAKARGVGIMLCPGVNIYRTALCGRNFEYYGEDPFLASEQAVAYIRGIQGQGIMATIKHFALNNQEYDRHGTNSVADEKTMNVIYLPTFRKAVQEAGVACVMTSYNPVNGVHAAENKELLGQLRGWGFDGIVMSDWTSTYSTVGVISGGLDLEMPKDYTTNIEMVRPLLENGVITEDQIDLKCVHILSSLISYGFLDKPVQDKSIPEDYELSRNLAYRAAVEGPVLLKNEGVLPIKASRKNDIVLLGPNADYVSFGGGSGRMSPFEERNITLFQAMKSLEKGYKTTLMTGDIDVAALKKASAVIVAVGFNKDTEKEGDDRTYGLPGGQDHLILTAAEANPNTIVIVNSGGEVDITAWKDKVAAIIFAWYGGQEGGKALADIITGKVSPSGKLPFTFWGSLEANPAYKYYQKTIPAVRQGRSNRDSQPITEYGEGVYLGYRGVKHFGVEPMYPFGYGLTYSSFEYANLDLVETEDGCDVIFDLKNTGKVTAKEVVQVYMNGILKGYKKVELKPGETRRVVIFMGTDAFKEYSVATHKLEFTNGVFEVGVGSSSKDIRLSKTIW